MEHEAPSFHLVLQQSGWLLVPSALMYVSCSGKEFAQFAIIQYG